MEEQTSVQSQSEHSEFLKKLLGIVSITRDVEG